MTVLRKKVFILCTVGVSVVVFFLVSILIGLLIFFRQCIPLVPYVPHLLGINHLQTYLILFQNNMELRPGGGFIGSYGTITVDKGRFGSLVVHNTYDADGQLKKHVEPYFIERRFIQKNLFMRDSNFDVDFSKSAQKVASMYQLETGHHVDGVIGLDLSYIQSLVELFSPLYIWQYNQSVTPKNFFLLTELHADKNSFNGSTQKQDFLHTIADTMLLKFHTNKTYYLVAILKKSFAAITEKHLLFASLDPTIQHVLSTHNFSSTLYDARSSKKDVINDFLGLNEANIGVNKSNYFLKRRIDHHVTIQNSGTILEDLKLTYANTSLSEEWPTGRYVAYMRVILPRNAKLTDIFFDGKKQKIVSAVTDPTIFEAPNFKPPDGLEVDHIEEEGKALYGFIIIVNYHSTLTVDVAYQLSTPVRGSHPVYDLVLFKQPGMNNDPLTFSLSYPSYYRTVSSNVVASSNAIPFMYLLKTIFTTDKHLLIRLSK